MDATWCSTIRCVCEWRFGVRLRVVGIDAQGSFFIDIGITHGDDDWIDRDVHHNHIEDEEANAKVGDGDNIEATRADGESLEKAVKSPGALREGRNGRVADLLAQSVGPVVMDESKIILTLRTSNAAQSTAFRPINAAKSHQVCLAGKRFV